MNLRDTAKVLAKAAAFDQRTVGEADVLAWHETVSDLDVDDALAAVSRWYRDRSDRLMPAHLREAVRLVRADRRKAARIAAAEAAAERASAAHEEPARRFWGQLEPGARANLSALSGGFLGLEGFPTADELRRERFSPPVRHPVYGDERQEGGR